MPIEVQVRRRLRDFELDVAFEAGDEPLAVLGPSGSGKTMLLRAIAGLERPDAGKISLNGRAVYDSSRRLRVPTRERRIGMLFQNFSLFPHKTARENIAFGLPGLSAEERERRIADAAQKVHVSGLESRFPRELSGGEQQRVALARALAIHPEALLLDEALTGLDTHLRNQIEHQLEETFASFGRPVLFVTHNMEEAYRLCRRMIVLVGGRVAASGATEEIFRHPPTVEVARLTGCKNFSRVRVVSETVVEALDWNVTLTVPRISAAPPKFVGIRAHHIRFVEAGGDARAENNVFPCRLARSSETPFRITLFLQTETAGASDSEFQLQAEVFKEKWERFKSIPPPWHVLLSPESLLLFPD